MDREEQAERREALKTCLPIIFLGVCRAWRDIALTTPRLWTTLCFQCSFYETPDEIPCGPSEIEAFIDRWLSRAGQLPLTSLSDGQIRLSHYPRCGRTCLYAGAHTTHPLSLLRHLELGMLERDICKLGLDSAELPLLKSAALGCNRSPSNQIPQCSSLCSLRP
ncbi:hypothetical protein FB451DRAFT_478940 [Mycena latifolia]|nr:hypothetical protein FB451DRAFT_478940 [Mycena latifolia]